MQTQLTNSQYDYLLGFYTHCFCVYHESATADFEYWAEQLDNHKIPWSVQNFVAVTAEDKASQSLYLRTHLAKRNITVH